MGNMSYCRFRNTERDLEDCIEALQNDQISSDEEWEAMKRMVNLCKEFLERAEYTTFQVDDDKGE